MDRRTIITKTGKGLMEATGKTSNLSRDLRNILKEIDGQVSVSALSKKLDDLTEPKLLEALGRLEKEGYLREFFGQQDDGPPSRPAAHAATPRAGPAPGADLDFSDLAAKVPARSDDGAKLSAQAQEIARQAQATRAREEAAAKARAPAPVRPPAQAESGMSALDRARREAEERARKEADERARRVEAERIRLEAEERARKEIEERALREITDRNRREAEEKARRQAEERTRRELEERVRREAEERARKEVEQRVKREAEERARREAEDRARREVEARAKLEAELRARLDAEDRARRDAEDRARYEEQERSRREEELRRRADEEVRKRREGEERRQREEQERREREELERSFREQEDKGRREAEEKARRDEERIRREWEERERIEAEAKAAAEEAARKAEEEERANAEEEAAPEEEEKAPEDEKARAKAEAKAAAQARKEARAREKAEEKERRRTEAPARGRSFADAAVSAREAWAKRRPANLGKLLATGLLVLLVVSIAVLPFVPMDPVPYRKAAQSWLDEPVAIGSVNVSFLPLPHLRFEKVVIGKDPQIRVATVNAVPEVGSLLGDRIALKSLDLVGVSFPRQFLPALLSAKGKGESMHVERITAKGVKLDIANLALPALDVDARLAADGAVESVTLSNAESKLLVTLQPKGGKAEVEVSADEFALPIGGDLSLGDFSATGTITAAELTLRKIEGRAFGGRLLGTARVGWTDGWSLDGELEARQMSPARIAPQILSGDTLQGKGAYSMKALVPDRLFMNARLDGNFSIEKGSIHNVDMMRMLQSGGTGGTTPFTEMSGSVTADPDRVALRQVRIVAGLMNATGQVEMDPEKNLSGRLLVELRAATVQARTTVTVSGTLQDPQFRR